MRLLSLFSGCGGMDIGFEGGFSCFRKCVDSAKHPDWIEKEDEQKVWLRRTGFDTVFADDIRPDAKRDWVGYFSACKADADRIYHLESIVSLVKDAKAGKFSFPKNIDVVTGGFPCQDFSVAGKRLGLDSKVSHLGSALAVGEPTNENRGHLYMWMRSVISIVKPKLFVAENVKGLTNLKNVKQVIEADFAHAAEGGYLVIPARVLYAPDYGVPQSRSRVIFFGFRKSALRSGALKALSLPKIPAEYDPYPPKTHGPGLLPYVTCADVLGDLPEPGQASDLSQQKFSKAKFLAGKSQGQTEIDLNGIGPTIRSEHHGNIEFRRLSASHGGRHVGELGKNLPERRLTVRECARIQTFPDEYSFVLPKDGERPGVSASDAYKIIGNAVPCLLAYNIAVNIKSKWELYFK